MITVRDIYAFLELIEQRNFNLAAEKLLLTQSGLSRKITHIEDHVQHRLFERTTRSVRPTREGLLLAKHWSEAVEHYQAGLTAIAAGDNELVGSLTIGVSGTSRYGAWQALGESFINRFPKVVVRLESIPSQDVIFHVENGDLEAGFCAGTVESSAVDAIKLEEIPYRALVPAAHPLAQRDQLCLADLKGLPLVLMNGKTWPKVRASLDAVLARENLLAQVAQEPHFVEMQIREVVENQLIGIHPSGSNQMLPAGVRQLEISDLGLVLCNYFIWRKTTTSPAVRALVNLVKMRPAAA